MKNQTGWYYLLEGQQKGPVTVAEIKGLLSDRVITADTPVWNPAYTAGWSPVHQVSEFKDAIKNYIPTIAPASSDHLSSTRDYTFAQPWRRLFARGIDLTLFTAITNATISPWAYFHLGQFASSLGPCGMAQFTQIFFLSVTALCQLSWMIQESLCLSLAGYTPGKWLLGVTVRDYEGRNLSFLQAFLRSIKIYVRGLGLLFLPLTLWCLLVQFVKVTRNKMTSWDREGKFRVEFVPFSFDNLGNSLSYAKYGVFVLCAFAIILIPIFAPSAVNRQDKQHRVSSNQGQLLKEFVSLGNTDKSAAIQTALNSVTRDQVDFLKLDKAMSWVLVSDPNNTTALTIRGLARAGMDDNFGAVNDYRQAIWRLEVLRLWYLLQKPSAQQESDLRAELAFLHYNCAYDLNLIGDRAGARDEYSMALREKPNYSDALCNRGGINFDFGDRTQAMADYDAALMYNPKHAQTYYNRAMAKGNLGRNLDAIPDFDKAITFNPNDASYYYGRAVAKNFSSIDRGIVDDLTNAIRLNPKYTHAYNNRAVAYLKNQQWREALSDCNKGLAIEPDFVMLYFNRGLAFLGLGDMHAAVLDLTKAEKLGETGARAILDKISHTPNQ